MANERNGGGRVNWRRVAGVLLAVVGVLITLTLVLLGSQEEPPSASMQGLLALAGIVSQLGAAWLFSGVGKPDPALAERAVARLALAASRAKSLETQVQGLYEGAEPKRTPSETRAGLGQISVKASYLADEIVEAIEDWNTFAPNAVTKSGALQSRPPELTKGDATNE